MNELRLRLDHQNDHIASDALRLTDLTHPLADVSRPSAATPSDEALGVVSPGIQGFLGPPLDAAIPPSSLPNVPSQTDKLDLHRVTPSEDTPADLAFPTVIDTSLPQPMHTKSVETHLQANRILRLPSFQTLGIASSSVDQRYYSPNEPPSIGGGAPGGTLGSLGSIGAHLEPLSQLPLTLHPEDAADRSSNPNDARVRHFITAYTPPDDAGKEDSHKGFFVVPAGGMDSPVQSDPDQTTPTEKTETSSAGRAPQASQYVVAPTTVSDSSAVGNTWMDGAVEDLVNQMKLESFDKPELKILCLALPVPCASGCIFPRITNRIIHATSQRMNTWVNVNHAVPPHFKFADIPASPSAVTPGVTNDGKDYFTSKVFDAVVAVDTYTDNGSSKGQQAMVKSPSPIVAPLSINLSILERYIPPPSSSEAKDLFVHSNSRSILLDRLFELSPDNGHLFFVYPTRSGGKTFQSDYLGPILEPLMRSMAIINSLPADLGMELHRIEALDSLVDYGELKACVEHFCQLLTSAAMPLPLHPPSSDRTATYTMTYAARHEVMPARAVWVAWWARQEEHRIRAAVTRFVRLSRRPAGQADLMSSVVLADTLAGVEKTSRPEWKPTKGIEVGVFVIRKTT